MAASYKKGIGRIYEIKGRGKFSNWNEWSYGVLITGLGEVLRS